MAINVSATDTQGLLGDAYGLCIWIQTQHPLHNDNILAHSLEVVLAFEVLLASMKPQSVTLRVVQCLIMNIQTFVGIVNPIPLFSPAVFLLSLRFFQ